MVFYQHLETAKYCKIVQSIIKTLKGPCGLLVVSVSRFSGIKAFSQHSGSHEPFMSCIISWNSNIFSGGLDVMISPTSVRL